MHQVGNWLRLYYNAQSAKHKKKSCISILSSIPKGRNPLLTGPVNVQAIRYLTYENAIRRSYSYMLHAPPIHCHWTGFEMTWHYTLLGVHILPPIPTSTPMQGKSSFWNVSQLALHQPVYVHGKCTTLETITFCYNKRYILRTNKYCLPPTVLKQETCFYETWNKHLAKVSSVYEAWPESIQPFWISQELVKWSWRNLAASQRRPYCTSVNSHSTTGLVSRQWDAVDWACVLCDRCIHKSPHFQRRF